MDERPEHHEPRPTGPSPERPEARRGPEHREGPPRRPAAPPKKARRQRTGVVTDPVADMLTRLRNGSRARHETVSMATSKLKVGIAKILRAEGFIAGYEVGDGKLTLRLRFVDGRIPALTDAKRVSRPGLRVYARRQELPRIRGGLGATIISTSQGLMTGSEALRKGLGGELLCAVW